MFKRNNEYENYIAKLTEKNRLYEESIKDMEWVYLKGAENKPPVKCGRPFSIHGKIFAEVLVQDAQTMMERVKTDHKKLFNWVANDFSGALNRANKKKFSFQYLNGDILSDAFVSSIAAIMKSVGFMGERYNKGELKQRIDAFLAELEDTEDDLPKNRKIIGDWNEIQVEFIFKLNKFLHESSVPNDPQT